MFVSHFAMHLRTYAAVLGLALTLALAACGGEDDEQTTENGSAQEPVQVPPADETASSEPPPADETASLGPAPFGETSDILYASRLWVAMTRGGALDGPDAVKTALYQGAEPHGEILEVIWTRATLGIHEGELIVKNNYIGDGITAADVEADPDKYLESITIMFKREAGYDPENHDWFWARLAPKLGNAVVNDAGVSLAGRIAKGMDTGCIACHEGAPGGDMLFTERPGTQVAAAPAPEPEPEVAAAPAP